MADKTNTNEPDKLDLRSMDISEGKRLELLELFPEIRTEGDKIDFDRLRLALGEMVDVGKERYGMNWPGKAECFKTIQSPSLGTLRPCPEESVNFDTTENLIIEGDNLEVLKLLQKSYLGKVKMIYIDPPYNTGNDFIYPDNYTESLQTYLEYTGQVDAEGRKFGTNTDAEGRYHSKWLNMMYSRLYLARNLLRDDGVIFISIDDNEVRNLRVLCDEIFGEDNFVVPVIWQKRVTPENRRTFSFEHDYILCYAREAAVFREIRRLLPLTPEARSRYKNPDNDPRGDWQSVPAIAQAGHGTKSQFYRLKTPNGRLLDPPPGCCWRYTEQRMKREIEMNNIWFASDGNGVPRIKRFLSDTREGITPSTLWLAQEASANEKAKKEVADLFSGNVIFESPKPTKLIQMMLNISTESTEDEVVLDFFAGSGTSAHAVLDLNKEDGGNRKFILVQLPEPTEREDFPTIADITKERVRRVIKKLDEEDEGQLDLKASKSQDRGFRVYKLDESNFKTWNADLPHDAPELEKQLELHVEHIREKRTNEDLFYEILLKSGFALTTPVEKLTLAEKTVYSVAGGALLVSLDRALTLEVIRAIAERKPERVVCLDIGFAGNDQLKANAVQIFKTKGVTSFKTV